MSRKTYKGIDKDGEPIKWLVDEDPAQALKYFKRDKKVIFITENDATIWRRN